MFSNLFEAKKPIRHLQTVEHMLYKLSVFVKRKNPDCGKLINSNDEVYV
jgi:hypothetical protein